MVSRLKYSSVILLTLGICFSLQYAALQRSGGRPGKCESNYFSSLGRIQAASLGAPQMLFLGSSITGRLPDRSQNFGNTANMGCDGGSAVDALRAIDRGILPSAPLIVVEANTLHLALSNKTTEISKAMQTSWFKIGMRFPCLSASARPSAFIYSNLLSKRIGSIEDLSNSESLSVKSLPQRVDGLKKSPLSLEQEGLVMELGLLMRRLEARGSQITIVWLPPRRGGNSAPPSWILELAERGGASWWDLGGQAPDNEIQLTDGVHMAVQSAARTSVSLLKGVRQIQ